MTSFEFVIENISFTNRDSNPYVPNLKLIAVLMESFAIMGSNSDTSFRT